MKRYWDIDVNPEEYSYLDAAITEGYSILTYDRLGTGQSDIPEDAYASLGLYPLSHLDGEMAGRGYYEPLARSSFQAEVWSSCFTLSRSTYLSRGRVDGSIDSRSDAL